MSRIIFDYSQRNKAKDILDELDALESAPITISDYRPASSKKKKSAVDEIEEANERGDEWLETIATFKSEPIKGKKRRGGDDFFEFYSGDGKKKKKKKKKDELIDYAKEFEPEMALTRNLLADSNRFVDSLQKRYDALENGRSSARGVGKFTTDLIGAINQARNVSMQLVNNMTSLKKTIADLNMKERKEKAAINGDTDNLGDFSSQFLKSMLNKNKNDLASYGEDSLINGDADDIFESVSMELGETGRSEDIDKYLKYESRNVEIVAVVDQNTDEYHLEAIASDGELIEDYPLPVVEHLDINRSTSVATDEYHTKYNIRWE